MATLSTGFYVGVSSYLNDSYAANTDAAAHDLKTANLVQQAVANGSAYAELTGLGLDLVCSEIDLEWANADDEEGIPVLLYANVAFDVPETYLPVVLENEYELDEQLTVVLHASNLVFREHVGLEVLDEDQ